MVDYIDRCELRTVLCPERPEKAASSKYFRILGSWGLGAGGNRSDWNQFYTDWCLACLALACPTQPKNWIPVCKCNIRNSHLARQKHGWWVPYRAWLLNWPRHDMRAASAKLTAASEISFSNSSALPLRNLSCICSSVQWSSMQPLKYNTAKSRICEASFYFCCCRTKQPQFRVVFLQL